MSVANSAKTAASVGSYSAILLVRTSDKSLPKALEALVTAFLPIPAPTLASPPAIRGTTSSTASTNKVFIAKA